MNIDVLSTSIRIYGYNDYTKNKFVERSFSIWDQVSFKATNMYEYDKDNEILYLPRGADLNILRREFKTTPNIVRGNTDYKKSDINLISPPRNDLQKEIISFITSTDKFANNAKYSQYSVVVPTGEGKTYCAIASICKLGITTLVIVHRTKIKDQWVNSFKEFTDLKDEQIGEISGSSSIDYILENPKNINFKLFITTHTTLNSYASKHGWDKIDELFNKLGIGMKIIDEAHLHFKNTVFLDLHTNVYKTIYLTATYNRSDRMEDIIFQRVFSNSVKYVPNENLISRKHVIYIGVLYNSNPSLENILNMTGKRGFDKHAYSRYLEESNEFYKCLDSVLSTFIPKIGDKKILILSSAINTTEKIKTFIKSIYPSIKVDTYHSKKPAVEKEESLNSQIICSTPSSAGVGFDVKNLKIVIMTEGYSSKVEAVQVPGRLRLLNAEDNTLYIELVDRGFRKVYDMYIRRVPIFKKYGLKVIKNKFS